MNTDEHTLVIRSAIEALNDALAAAVRAGHWPDIDLCELSDNNIDGRPGVRLNGFQPAPNHPAI